MTRWKLLFATKRLILRKRQLEESLDSCTNTVMERSVGVEVDVSRFVQSDLNYSRL